jgi:phenylalanyl-tRNA synthetase beta chain
MKFSEAWLRQHVQPLLDTAQLAEQITGAGLEVDSIEPVAADFSGIVVGEVLSVEKHPNAEKLSICRVNVGQAEPLQIVCGARNVVAGMKVPAALIGAVIGEDFRIKQSKLRGEESFGMLCSAKELGLAEASEGLLPLPDDAPVGEDVRRYLQLDDQMIELELTPNRGDCLSIKGIAREVAVLNNISYTDVVVPSNPVILDEKISVQHTAKAACPHYAVRIIRGLATDATTPLWLQERLRRSGIRSINPVVDITNYVMLELGQPLHAFDLEKIQGGLCVRQANANESLTLLDETTITLTNDDLVIADQQQALALAGVMGGAFSAVSTDTQHIVLESAYFKAEPLALTARRFGLYSDSSRRYERNVDFQLQITALERATELLLAMVGGQAGPIVECTSEEHLPQLQQITLRHARIERVLGYQVAPEDVTRILQQLGMVVKQEGQQWQVTPPSYRLDIALEIDCIEEVGRVLGYDKIPYGRVTSLQQLRQQSESTISMSRIQQVLLDRDYYEAITYSFVDPAIQQQVAPHYEAILLQNPISQTMSAMRTSLWPGLIQAALYNVNRQQERVRLFEHGLCFTKAAKDLVQEPYISGLILGAMQPEQWTESQRDVDFYDIKNDVEALLQLTGRSLDAYEWRPTQHPALHPGLGADIVYKDQVVGHVGLLHPKVAQELDIKSNLWLFELKRQLIEHADIPKFATLSKYPAIRRDIALVVAKDVSSAAILSAIKKVGGQLLVDLTLFDVYHGDRLPAGQKSIAIGLLLQHPERTLQDAEVSDFMDKIINTLKTTLGAVLRES